MDDKTALKWAGLYTALAAVATVVAGAIVAAGVAAGGLAGIGLYGYTPGSLRVALYPRAGLAVIVLGIVVWWIGQGAALYRTLVTAIEDETAAHFDAESMKSDILSVLDDRLADVHQEVSETRRLVDRLAREDAADAFEFSDELGDD